MKIKHYVWTVKTLWHQTVKPKICENFFLFRKLEPPALF